MAVATLTPLPPAEAIAALQRRGQRLDPTFSWQEAWQDEHARMFTVAKSAGFDILKDIHGALVQALAEGRTFQDFARDLRPVLEEKGWWGRKEAADPGTGEIRTVQLGSTRRLRTIFETNMRVSYAAGHWAQFERNRKTRPILRYVAILDGRARPAHQARHNLALPVDDPYWDTWAPPCGWGCRCTLQSLSLRDFERMKGELKTTPPVETARRFTNKATGEVVKVPDGIDPGWAYNPGKAGWRAASVADKLVDAPPQLAAAAAGDRTFPAAKLADEFASWWDVAASGKPVDRTPWIVGAVDQAALPGLAHQGVELRSAAIGIDDLAARRLAAQLPSGGPAAAAMRRLPEGLAAPRAVLFDPAARELVYVLDAGDGSSLGIRVACPAEGAAEAAGRPRANPVRSAEPVDPAALIRAGLVLLSGAV